MKWNTKLFVTCSLAFVFLILLPQKAHPSDFRLRLNQLEREYTIEDVRAEVSFGRNLAAKILHKYPLSQDQQIQNYLSLLGHGIVSQIGRSDIAFHFAVIDTPEINAYACPGGYIFITAGAIKAMENEAQLVGVLAHEISHVNHRDIVKRLKIRAKDDGISRGVAAAFGGTSATARVLLKQLTDKAFSLLFEEGISKESELSADKGAVEIMKTIQYDWKSYQEYLNKIESLLAAGQGEVILKTHPSTSDRTAHINRLSNSLQLNKTQGKQNVARFQKYQTYL